MIYLSAAATHVLAENARVLFSFNGTVGSVPIAPLISDAAGNFYGTTSRGGAYDGGTAFTIKRTPQGGWTGNLIYEFGNGTDGNEPLNSLLLDGRGNLYGITKYGGTSGEGTVFQLTPSAQGWKESILKNFILRDAGGLDPSGNLIFDKAGNLYGTTLFGGNLSGCPGAGCGTVYELTPGQEGKWTETVLYAPPDAYHGSYPRGGLVFDASGNLYGADLQEIFELRPSGGARTKNAIHTFTGTPDGYQPNGNLIFDKAGNLYGTTYIGGTGTGATCDSEGCGTVFELSPRGDGTWNESILHSFSENGTDGYLTYASVILGPGGVLYGTAPLGGNQTNCYGGACGIAFALVPKSGGGWTKRFFTTLVAIAAVVPNQTWL